MKNLRYILFTAVIVCIPLFIDDVYAFQVNYKSGSCNLSYVNWYNRDENAYYLELRDCQAGTQVYLTIDDFYCGNNPISDNSPLYTLVQSVNALEYGVTPKNINYSFVFDQSVKIDGFSYYKFDAASLIYSKSSSISVSRAFNLPRSPTVTLPTAGSYFFIFQNTCLYGDQSTNIQTSVSNGKLDDVNQSINDVNDSITSTESPDLGELGNSAGWLPAGPVDSILNLPLVLLQNLLDSLSSTCEPVSLPLPYVDKELELPCINSVYSKIGSLSIWINSIGVIIAAFLLYRYLLSLYQWVDDTLSFRENHWNDTDQWGGI